MLLLITSHINSQEYNIHYTYPRTKHSKYQENRKYGILDSNRQILVPAIYDEISDFAEGLARAVKNDKVGFINKSGDIIIPFEYEKDTQFITGQRMTKTARYNSEGNISEEILTGRIEEEGLNFWHGLVCVVKNGKYGFINRNNEVVIPFIYDGADNFRNGVAIVMLNQKFGAIDKKGEQVIPIHFNQLVWMSGSGSELYAEKDGNCYFMNIEMKKTKEWCNRIIRE
jgi:hypothetical protein